MRCDVSKHAHLRNSERVIWVVRICVPFAMAPLGHLFLCVAVFFAWARNGQSLAAMMAIKNESKTVTMEKEILKLMGLPRRPQISLATMMFGRRMSAPRFMMELYNSLAANQSVTVDGPRFNGSVTDPRAVRADTIVGYLNHSKSSVCCLSWAIVAVRQLPKPASRICEVDKAPASYRHRNRFPRQARNGHIKKCVMNLPASISTGCGMPALHASCGVKLHISPRAQVHRDQCGWKNALLCLPRRVLTEFFCLIHKTFNFLCPRQNGMIEILTCSAPTEMHLFI